MKEFADDNFKFDENGRKLPKRKVTKTDRKHFGIRRNCLLQAISPFPTVFSKGLFPGASKSVIVWKWVKVKFPLVKKCLCGIELSHHSTLYQRIPCFKNPWKEAL